MYFNCRERYEDIIDHRSYIKKPEKNSGLQGVQIHDLCDTSDHLPVGLIAQLVDHCTAWVQIPFRFFRL